MDFVRLLDKRTNNVTETSQGNSSDTENGASSSPSPGTYQVATSTNTSAAVSVQASLTEIQAGQFSLSQQPVSHAEQQLQQLQKQQLELQQQHQQQQPQNHHNNSKTSNHHSHQNAFTQHYNSITHHHNQIPTTANPGSYPHHIKIAQPPISGPAYEVTANVNELVQFAEKFKQRRNEMGFSQEDVSRAIRKQYGNKCSDSTISKFEALKLSFQKLCEIKSLLQKWLENAETFLTNPGSLTNQMITTEPIERHREKRTYIHLCVTVHLETAFLQNPTPKSEEIGILAQNLAMEKEVVRIWFENRRQKEEEINTPRTAMGSSTITESATSNMFESNAATGNPTITESATSNMFASIAATGNPTITESAHSYMLASMATMVTETTQNNLSGTENRASSSPSPGLSQATSYTSTPSEVSVQDFPTEIHADHLSLSQVQEGVSHAEEQLEQLQKQQLQQQEQQQQQQNHHHHSKTSNHHSHQNTFTQHHANIKHYHNQIPTTPNLSSFDHHTKTAPPQILEPSPGETAERKEVEEFAKNFKQRRIELGFTQSDVRLAMGKLYGNEVSDTTISRFEALKLSPKNMCDLKTLLQKWLEDAESLLANPESLANPKTTRRKYCRTSKDKSVIVALEKAFLQNPKPTSEEISMLAESLAMEKKVVSVWFYNRRYKEKKNNAPIAAMGSPTITESAPSNMVASIANSLDKS